MEPTCFLWVKATTKTIRSGGPVCVWILDADGFGGCFFLDVVLKQSSAKDSAVCCKRGPCINNINFSTATFLTGPWPWSIRFGTQEFRGRRRTPGLPCLCWGFNMCLELNSDVRVIEFHVLEGSSRLVDWPILFCWTTLLNISEGQNHLEAFPSLFWSSQIVRRLFYFSKSTPWAPKHWVEEIHPEWCIVATIESYCKSQIALGFLCSFFLNTFSAKKQNNILAFAVAVACRAHSVAVAYFVSTLPRPQAVWAQKKADPGLLGFRVYESCGTERIISSIDHSRVEKSLKWENLWFSLNF